MYVELILSSLVAAGFLHYTEIKPNLHIFMKTYMTHIDNFYKPLGNETKVKPSYCLKKLGKTTLYEYISFFTI